MKIGDEIYIHGYVDEIRKDCVIIRNDGGYFGTVESEIVKAENIVPIIRCKDCKYHFYEHDYIPYCANIDYGYGWRDEDYCSKAERREE